MEPDARRLEFVKIAAIVAMVCDHIDLFLLGRQMPALHEIGRFAFPAFCLAFGIGIGTSRDPLAAVDRLIIPGVIAQVAWIVGKGDYPANVLIMFAACAVAGWAVVRKAWAGVLAFAVVLGTAVHGMEGSFAGPLLVMAGWAATRTGNAAWALVGGLAWAALTRSPGAAVAGVAVFTACLMGPVWRKTPGLPWIYAGHLVLLVAIAPARVEVPPLAPVLLLDGGIRGPTEWGVGPQTRHMPIADGATLVHALAGGS